jgi:peptidyl-prolyl isomerase E (cyclophilin E)
VLHAAFLPFGELKDVSVPVDHGTQKNRGFGFVTFVEPCAPRLRPNPDCSPRRAALTRVHAASPARSEDCAAAMDNMHNAELYGRVLRCNYAQPQKIRGGETGFSNQPVWADADTYQNALDAEGGAE